ncbi:serine hydrolase domain-containing protein [Asticcacaulis excentricus]|uniref:Beta-lactamase n=1 Tax=Asticcacaulis excentricus (strain ATCC 15261 / DSM 4724 / KCTC 12464 / NCIMB 9791 / VKM B-1370 / CB 48) TaxID=573065 RepID=E8RV75_ASTEC|nr:serine hydrolase domain-containing protein [Asticcacaulis excentricus]ADU14275.1 beta-lactamase [Asticcacaulis excentricus CB 48]
MRAWLIGAALAVFPSLAVAQGLPKPVAIDAEVQRVLKDTGAKGLAIAVIDNGKVGYVQAYGVRNPKGEPLTPQTVMYGASLTKAVFAYTVMQQVDQGRLTLDTPLADMLPQPLPSYASPDIINRYSDWSALDERWRKLTPRIVLTHSSGFANFYFLEPDEKLKFHFDPGARYAYSGDGLLTLQFAMEMGLGLSLRDETDRIFKGLGMTRSSLIWRSDFAGNLADGWNDKGEVEVHDERSKVRVAGSMDTTISDFARFAAAFVRGEGLSPAARAEITKRQLKITTRTQFPPFQPELPADQQRADLYAGLGVVVFDGPQGHGFYKGGHNDITANTWVCVEKSKRCVVILSNDVRAEARFAALVKFVLGETGVPYEWEYGDHAGKS